jgi:hypothetical protein
MRPLRAHSAYLEQVKRKKILLLKKNYCNWPLSAKKSPMIWTTGARADDYLTHSDFRYHAFGILSP